MKKCKVKKCGRKHNANGYCARHNIQVSTYDRVLKRTIKDSNEIIIKGDTAEIILYNREQPIREVARAIIDAEDVDKVKNYKWHHKDGYVSTFYNKKYIPLSHVIMNPDPGLDVDHEDHNTLNNRKYNLRSCTHAQNMQNQGLRKNNTSGYTGILKHGNKWRADIGVNNKSIYLGLFDTKEQAALMYNVASTYFHGDFSVLNNIPGEPGPPY